MDWPKRCLRCGNETREKDAFSWDGDGDDFCICFGCAEEIVEEWKNSAIEEK